MPQAAARIHSVRIFEPLPSMYRVRLVAPGLASAFKPGQFFLAITPTEYVRRVCFPIALEDDGFSLLLARDDPLSRLTPGDELDCLGPLGTWFPMDAAARNLLLLAQAGGAGALERQNGVLLLLTLIDAALAAGRNLLLIQEAPTAAQLFPAAGLPRGVEVRQATLDGSRGPRRAALELLPDLVHWADQVYAVGAPEWYPDLMRALRAGRLGAQEGVAWGVIAPEVMPCGMGVCGGCAVETGHGYRLACTDGPVFDLSQV